ncbi:MAG: nickel-dependent hydrogenase large subunit [Spirochaetota bacterium]|nr:nickel-dependent hydrogenase large subunit [Spirochaetota bacterium]
MAKIVIDPLSRIEGHLSIEIDVDNGMVNTARCRGDMFRGFEMLLKGRNPVDAIMITQRICGVCPISHAVASSKCLESAFEIQPSMNGMLLRNLTLAANFLQSHIIHFYHLAALDYVDIKAILQYKGGNKALNNLKSWAKSELEKKSGTPEAFTALSPFLPRYEGEGMYIQDAELNATLVLHYVMALDIRMKTHKLTSIFGGKVPHAASLLPGGVSQKVTKDKLDEYRYLLNEIERFVNDVYLNDIIEIAKAFPDYSSIGRFDSFLSYGVFGDDLSGDFLFSRGIVQEGMLMKFDPSLIKEYVKHSRYKSESGLHPSSGETDPDREKDGAYSWAKAPRYNDMPHEVGPLARIVVSYVEGSSIVKKEVDSLLSTLGISLSSLFSVVGRHAARMIECKILCEQAKMWLDQIKVNDPTRTTYRIPQKNSGMGLTEAPRGALGHWIDVDNYLIDNYQCVVPTTWNIGPEDDNGNKGVIEQALAETPISDKKSPVEAARVVRSFDPCLACAIHIVEGDRHIKSFRVS